ncbi:DUF6676 family protein [Corynebacterium appendicis]|uniref:Rv1476 family membrane protein n=1 Tax=Corynebacterium appendicis TaxID=163202 RepID=UPI002549CEB7|nr:DUF6676 family protein [Corynebacterium appendicis]MDK8625041.1 hypothetical protein [Corynebacterium appendicis]
MDPSAPDFDSLRAQLIDDAVAFGTDNPVNDALQADVLSALSDIRAGEAGAAGPAGRIGVVVLEQTGQPAGHLRDLAQDLKNATNAEAAFDTVIVRTPASTAAVSDSLSRAQVEKGQYALISEPDYAEGVRAFAAAADGFSVPWLLVAVTLVALLIVVAATSSLAAARRD